MLSEVFLRLCEDLFLAPAWCACVEYGQSGVVLVFGFGHKGLDLEPVVVVVPVPLALLLLVLLLVLLFLVFILLPLLVLPVPPVSVVAIAARPAAAARAGPPAHRAEWLGIERLVRKHGLPRRDSNERIRSTPRSFVSPRAYRDRWRRVHPAPRNVSWWGDDETVKSEIVTSTVRNAPPWSTRGDHERADATRARRRAAHRAAGVPAARGGCAKPRTLPTNPPHLAAVPTGRPPLEFEGNHR